MGVAVPLDAIAKAPVTEPLVREEVLAQGSGSRCMPTNSSWRPER